MKKSKLAIILFYFLPVAFIVPPFLNFFGIRISFVDLTCWMGFALLISNSWKAKKLIVWTILLVIVTIISNLWGMIIIGYGFNLKNFAFIKYLFTYLGAIAIGTNLPTKNILKNKLATFSLIALFTMSLLALLSPEMGALLSSIYGQANNIDESGRLMFLDPNPNMVGQIAMILTILSVLSLKKSQLKVALAFISGATIIFITTSRANLLILFIFMICYYTLILREKGKWKGTVLVILTGIIMFTSYSYYAKDRYLHERIMRITNLATAVMGRIDVFGIAVNDFSKSPIIGTGYKTSTSRGSKSFIYSRGEATETHSQWLGFLFNHGILGFSILFGFFIAIGRRLWGLYKMYNKDKERIQVVMAMLALYICYFLSMIGWETFYLPQYSLVFFLFFGKLYQLRYDLNPLSIDLENRASKLNTVSFI